MPLALLVIIGYSSENPLTRRASSLKSPLKFLGATVKNIKIYLVVLTFLSAVTRPAQAATSSSTAEFLKKLNGYYYCLSQEGLKNYHCDVVLSDVPSGADTVLWGAVQKTRFTVDDSVTDATSVQGIPASPIGNAQLDARVTKLQQVLLDSLKTFIQSWKSFVMEPLNDPADMGKNDLKFKREESGFKVAQTDSSGALLVGSFDKKGKLLEFLIQDGGSKTMVQPGFAETQKGYLLTGLLFRSADADQTFKVEYGVVGGYWLPKDLSLKVNLADWGAGDAELHLHFSNYRVNQ